MDSIEKSSLPCSGEKLGEDETGVQEVGEDSDSSELDDVMIIGEHKMIDDELVCDNYLKEDLEDFISDEVVSDSYLSGDIGQLISCEVGQLCDNLPNVHGDSSNFLSQSGPDDSDYSKLVSNELNSHCKNKEIIDLTANSPEINFDHNETIISSETNFYHNQATNSSEINVHHNQNTNSPTTFFDYNQATNSSETNIDHNQPNNSSEANVDHNETTDGSEISVNHNQPTISSETNVDHNQAANSSETNFDHSQSTNSPKRNVYHNQTIDSSETNVDHNQPTNSSETNVNYTQATDSSEISVDHNQADNSSETDFGYSQSTNSPEIDFDHSQSTNSPEIDFDHNQSTNSPETNIDHSQSTNSPETNVNHSQNTNSPETNVDHNQTANSSEISVDHNQADNSSEISVDHNQADNSSEISVDHNQADNSSEISVDHNQADNSSETDFDHSQSTDSPETNVDHNQTTNSSETNVDHNQNINSPTTIFDYNQATNSPEINGDRNQPNNSPKTNLDHNETTDSSEINVDHDQVTNSSETNFNHTQTTNSPETNVNHNQVTNSSEINFDHSQSTNGPEANVDLNQATNSSETNFDLSQSTNSLETKLFVDHNQPTNSSETNVDHNQARNSSGINFDRRQNTNSPETNVNHNQATNSSEINFDHSQNTNSSETTVDHNQATNSSETNVDHNQATNSSETNFDLSQNTNSSETNLHHSQTTTTSPRINFVHNQTTNNPEINFDCKELGVACDSHENNNNDDDDDDDNDTENLTQNKCLQNATSTSDLKVDNLIASNSCCELEVKNTINNTSTVIVSKTNVITEVTRDENCEGREVVELGNIITDKSPLLNSSPSESGGSVSELKVDNLNTSESCDGLSVKSANNAISDVTIPQKLYEINANDVSAEVTSNKSCEQKGFEKENKDADKLLNSCSSIEIKAAGVSPLNENIENVESDEVNKPESVKYEENVPRPKRGRGRPRKHKIQETKIKDAENVKAVEEEEEVERLRKHITESSLKKLVICVSKVDDDAYKESLRSKKDVNAMNKERSSNMLESNLLKNRESNNYCVEHCSPDLELEGNNFESSTNSLKSFDTHSLDTVERLSIDSAGSSSSTKSDIESNKQTELKDREFLNKTRTTSQQKTLKSIPTVSAKTKVKCNTVSKKYPTRNRISFMPNNSISTSKSKNHFNRNNNAKITIKNSKLAKAKNDSVTNITRRKVYRKLVSFEPMEANAVKPSESSRSVGKKKERTSIDEGRTRLRHEETSKELPSNSEQISVNSGCVLKTFESNCDDDELGTKMSLTDSSDLPLERKASEKVLESQSGEISGSENETCSNRINTHEESELNCENKKAKHFCLNKHSSKIVCTDKHQNNSGQNEIINEENSSKKSNGKEREQNLTNDSLAITNSDSEDLKNTRKDCLNKTDIVEKNESLRSKKNEESATTEEKNRVVNSEEKKETNDEIRQNKSETKRKLDLNLQQGLQRGRRRSPSKLSLRMKQEVQEQCCGHWFPNTKGFIRHLIENSKNEADSLHAAKLIDLGMQKCTICAVWLNFITLKKHLKKVHDDIKPVNQQNCTSDSVPDTKTENNTTVVDQDLKTKGLKTKDLKTKDLKTKALKMKDLRTKALKTKALRTKDLKTKGLRTKGLKTIDLKTKDLKAKDLKAKDLKAKDLKAKDLKAKDLKAKDLKAKDLKAKDLKAKDLKAKDMKAKDLKAKDLKAKDLKSKDLKSKDLKSKDLKTKDLKTKDLKTKDLKTKDLKTKDLKTKDLKTKDLKTKDLKTKDLKTKDSIPNVLMSDEAVKPKPKSRKPVFEKRTQKPCPMSKKRNSDSSENNDRIICDLNQDPKSTASSIAIYSIEDLPNHFKPFIIMPRCKMKIKKKRTRLKNKKKSPLDSEKTSLLALKKKLNDFKDLEEIKNSLDITKDQLDAPGDLCEKKLVDTKIKDSDTPVTEKMGERQTPKLRKTDALKFKRKPKAQKTPLNKSGNLKQQKQCNSEPLPSRSLNDKQMDKELKDNSENTLVSKNNKIKARRHSIESNPVRKPIRKRKSRHSLTESAAVIKESAVIRATPLGRIKIRGNKMRGRPLRRRRCGFHSSGSSDGSSDSSESSSFSDFEREFLDDDDDSKENEENIPTVELDLFTLSSFNEDVSVLLVDPKNPNFKVFASMDAIFVGDSALGDVTNQVGYISDNNNVVYVNPSHFLFPKVGSSESEIPVLKSKKPLNSLHRLKEKEVIQTNIKKTVKKNVVQPNMKLTATTLLASNCKENSFSKASNDKENSFSKSSIIKKEVVTLGKLKQETVKSIKSEIKVSKEVFLSISKASTESKTTAEVKIDKLPEQDQVRKEISQPRKEASVTILKQDKSEGVKCESKAVEASSGFPKLEKQGSARETHDNKIIIIKTSMKKDSERRNIKKTNSEIKAQAFSSHKKNISSGNIISLGEAVLAVAPSVREEKVLKTFTLNPVKNVVQGLETDVPYKVLADSKNPIIPNNIDYSNLDIIDVIDCNSSNNPINVCSLYSNEKSQTHKENPTTNLPQSHCSKVHSISVNSPVKISPPAEPKSLSPVKISPPAEPKSLSPVKISPFAEPKSLSPIKISPFAEPKSLSPVKISTESLVVIASAEIVPFGTLEGGVCLEEVMQQESNNLIVTKDEDLHTPSKASPKETKEVNLPPLVTESEREKSPKLECDSLDDLSNLEVDKFSDLESISDPCPPGDFSDVVKGNNLWSTPLLFTLENSSKAPDTDPDDVPLILLSPKSNQKKLSKDEKEDNKDDLLGIPLSQIPDFLSPSKNLLTPFGDQVQKLMNNGPVELSPNTVSAALSPNVKGTKSKKSSLEQVDELLKVSDSVKSSPEEQGTLFSNKVVNTEGNTLPSIEKENSKAKHEEEILPHSLFEGIPPVHQDNLTKKKRHKRKKHKKVDESRAVDETFQFQGGPLPSADCVPQEFVKRSSSRPDSDILKMKILLKDLPTHDVSSLFKKQRSHKRKKKKHTKKKRKEREEVDTSVSPSKKKRHTLETPVISPCQLKMDEIEDIAKDGLLSVCNKVKENKDGELIKDEGGNNNKEERMSGEVGKKGDIAREKKQTRSNREEEKRSKKEEREDEVVEDKELIVKNRNKKLVLKQFDSFSMTPPVSENVLSSPDRISEDEIVDIEGIDAEMDLTSMKINVREEIPEVLKDPPDGVKKDPIPTDAVNISDYVDKKSPKNLSLRSWLERGSKLITDQQSSVINSRVVKEASELVTPTTTTPILNVKPSHHLVDDRLWHSRGAKLKAQVMITDHQRGITDSSVKGELGFSPIKSVVPSPVTRKSGKKKTDLAHTKDIRSYFSQPGVYSAEKSPSLKSPPRDSRPQPLYFKSSPPPSPSPSNSPSTSLSTSSTSFKTTPKTRKKLILQTPPNPRPSKITNSPSLSSEKKKRKRKRTENNMDIRLFFTDRKSTKDSNVCYLPPAKKPRLSNVKTEPDQNEDDDDDDDFDFEGFHTCPRQWGLRSKMLQKYVDVLDMNTWFNCDRFPVPVDRLCDWNEDQLNHVLFEKG